MFDQDTRKRHPTMTHHQSALTTLISEVLTDPDLAHNDVFRRLLQAGVCDQLFVGRFSSGCVPCERPVSGQKSAKK